MVTLLAACDPGDVETSTQLAETQIPQTSGPASTDGVPDISEIDQSALVLAVLPRVSFDRWSRVWVNESGLRLTDEDREAISATIGPLVQFVADSDEAWGDSGILPEDEVLLSFTKLNKIKSDVVAIDQWLSLDIEAGSARTWLFQWDGEAWMIVDPEQVDVTVTTAVS